MKIRSPKPADLEKIKFLRKSYYQNIGEKFSEKEITNIIENPQKNQKEKILIAEDNGEFTGFIWVIEQEPNLIIKAIHVMPDKQQKGTGRNLMKEVEKIARQKKIKAITLTMKPTNEKAKKLYEKQGYHIDRYILKKEL